jgi:excisionase family DNA binding protein
MDLSVSEAAEALGISRQRVNALVRGGALASRRAGDRVVLIDRESVERRRSEHHVAGRALSERSCWSVLLLAAGRPLPDLSRAERARAAQRLRDLDRARPQSMRNRARVAFYRAHPAVLARLREDSRLSLGGRDAASAHQADIVLDDSVDAYVAEHDLDGVVDTQLLREVRRADANVILRVVGYDPARALLSGEVVPALLLGLDLVDAGDARSVRAGHQLIARELLGLGIRSA